MLDIFSRIGRVLGVGITKIGDDYAVKVNLREPLARSAKVPKAVRGVPVKVACVGRVKARG